MVVSSKARNARAHNKAVVKAEKERKEKEEKEEREKNGNNIDENDDGNISDISDRTRLRQQQNNANDDENNNKNDDDPNRELTAHEMKMLIEKEQEEERKLILRNKWKDYGSDLQTNRLFDSDEIAFKLMFVINTNNLNNHNNNNKNKNIDEIVQVECFEVITPCQCIVVKEAIYKKHSSKSNSNSNSNGQRIKDIKDVILIWNSTIMKDHDILPSIAFINPNLKMGNNNNNNNDNDKNNNQEKKIISKSHFQTLRKSIQWVSKSQAAKYLDKQKEEQKKIDLLRQEKRSEKRKKEALSKLYISSSPSNNKNNDEENIGDGDGPEIDGDGSEIDEDDEGSSRTYEFNSIESNMLMGMGFDLESSTTMEGSNKSSIIDLNDPERLAKLQAEVKGLEFSESSDDDGESRINDSSSSFSSSSSTNNNNSDGEESRLSAEERKHQRRKRKKEKKAKEKKKRQKKQKKQSEDFNLKDILKGLKCESILPKLIEWGYTDKGSFSSLVDESAMKTKDGLFIHCAKQRRRIAHMAQFFDDEYEKEKQLKSGNALTEIESNMQPFTLDGKNFYATKQDMLQAMHEEEKEKQLQELLNSGGIVKESQHSTNNVFPGRGQFFTPSLIDNTTYRKTLADLQQKKKKTYDNSTYIGRLKNKIFDLNDEDPYWLLCGNKGFMPKKSNCCHKHILLSSKEFEMHLKNKADDLLIKFNQNIKEGDAFNDGFIPREHYKFYIHDVLLKSKVEILPGTIDEILLKADEGDGKCYKRIKVIDTVYQLITQAEREYFLGNSNFTYKNSPPRKKKKESFLPESIRIDNHNKKTINNNNNKNNNKKKKKKKWMKNNQSDSSDDDNTQMIIDPSSLSGFTTFIKKKEEEGIHIM